MKILVTGSSGIIGKELIKILLMTFPPTDIVGIDIKDNFESRIEFIKHDLSRGIPMQVVNTDWDVIFHLAAVFGRLKDDYWYLENSFIHNVQASHNLIGNTRSKKFIFASSYLVYDVVDKNNLQILDESSRISPRNIVGSAKYFTEQELKFEKENNGGFDFVSARISRVYGNGTNDVIGRFVRNALSGKPNTVYATDAEFDYIHARDVAMGLYKLWLNQCSGIYNLGSGKSYKIREVINKIRETCLDIHIELDDTNKKAEKTVLNINKLINDTKWKPTISLKKGIKGMVEYERQSTD